MGLLGNETHTIRRPRVKYGTLRQHFRTFSSPESAARHAWVNFRAFSLPKGARQNDVRIRGTLRQRNPYFSSPKSKIRYAWVTLPRLFVARECSTTRSGDTSAHFRCSKVSHGTLRQQNPHFPSSGGAGLLLSYVVEVGVAGGVVRERGVFDQGIHVKLVTGHYVAL